MWHSEAERVRRSMSWACLGLAALVFGLAPGAHGANTPPPEIVDAPGVGPNFNPAGGRKHPGATGTTSPAGLTGSTTSSAAVVQLDELLKQADLERLSRNKAYIDAPKNMVTAVDPNAKNATKKPVDPATAASVEQILGMYTTAEERYKAQQYREAASFYASVALATLPDKRVQMAVVQSRKRFVEMEDLAKQHLKNADDAEMTRDFVKAIEELGIVTRDFPFTNTKLDAERRFINLRSRKETAGHIEYAQAEAVEASGNMLQAWRLYKAIAENPQYENSVPALKAKRKAEGLPKDDASRENFKQQEQAEADKLAPQLLMAARNYIANGLVAQAKEKFRAVTEKFPSSKYAEEAQKELDKLP